MLQVNRISVLATILLLASCAPGREAAVQQAGVVATPNIVLIFVDDMGYADINPFSPAELVTPALDRMAAEGAVFTQFRVAQPVCSASRAALLTGAYSNRVGIHGALFPGTGIGLAPEETTLAELLKQQGYVTALFGKWHLGDAPELLPVRQGFDHYFGIPYSNDMWPQHPLQERFGFADLPLYENDVVLETLQDQSDLTRRLTERSVEFIRDHKDERFFLYLAHPQPHTPIFASAEFRGSTGQGLYRDVVAELDWSVGEILRTLQEEDLDDETLVIFTSDNGPWLSFGNHAGSAAPLREGKNTVFEGGVRVPFVARWPGHIPAGKRSDTPFMSIDLLPTLATLAGAPLPPRKIDGVNAWDLLSGVGTQSPQPAYFLYFGNNELQGVLYGPWKLLFPHTYQSIEGGVAGMDGAMGTYQARQILEIELYNLEEDPGEQRNVAAAHPDVVAVIEALADGMRSDLGDSLRGIEGSGRRPAAMLK